MLSSLKLYTFIALFAFTFARKNCKNAKTPKVTYPIGPTTPDCPTACTDCGENQYCVPDSPGDNCSKLSCQPFNFCFTCSNPQPECPQCGDGERCEIIPQTCFSCARAVCVVDDIPCPACVEPKRTCDSCKRWEVCLTESDGHCSCPETKCVQQPEF